MNVFAMTLALALAAMPGARAAASCVDGVECADLNVDALQAAAKCDAPLDEIRPVCQLFHYLLPELVVNVAFFRAQLQTRT